MKRLFTTLLLVCSMTTVLMAQRSLMIAHANGNTDYIPTTDISEITFSSDFSKFTVTANDGTEVSFDRSDIQKMGYTDTPTAFVATYNGSSATIQNPYVLKGVTATLDGAHLTITNPNVTDELTFELTGSTTDGSLLYNGQYKSTFVLNGVSITNTKGAAIDIECGKRIALELKKNTVNTLVDGANGEQKAALYCKGHLEIDKAGTLNVTGNTKHAISAKEYIQLKKAEGTINILGAKGDGIHCQQYFLANGYTVNIQKTEGDGIQAELSSDDPYEQDYADGSITIQGGTFSITTSAADVSGIKADSDITINEVKSTPSITISMSGNGSKGMKADGKLTVEAGDINISTTGGQYTDTSSTTTRAGGWPGGGGFNPGGGGFPGGGGGGWNPGGESSNSSSAKGIKAKGAIVINGGSITVNTTGTGAEGIESKTSIEVNGGQHYVKAYDDCMNSSGQIVFNGGITICYSNGNDAIDSNYGRTGAIVIGNGVVFAYSSKGSPEMGLDCDNNSYIQIKGNGIGISAGGTQGNSGSATLSSAAQGYAFVTSSISFQSSRYYTLADASDKNLVTFKLDANVSSTCTFITATGMVKNSKYTLKYGTSAPTDATTNFHGIYLGSSATGSTSVASITAK